MDDLGIDRDSLTKRYGGHDQDFQKLLDRRQYRRATIDSGLVLLKHITYFRQTMDIMVKGRPLIKGIATKCAFALGYDIRRIARLYYVRGALDEFSRANPYPVSSYGEDDLCHLTCLRKVGEKYHRTIYKACSPDNTAYAPDSTIPDIDPVAFIENARRVADAVQPLVTLSYEAVYLDLMKEFERAGGRIGSRRAKRQRPERGPGRPNVWNVQLRRDAVRPLLDEGLNPKEIVCRLTDMKISGDLPGETKVNRDVINKDIEVIKSES